MKGVITVRNPQDQLVARHESTQPHTTDLIVRALRFLHPDCTVDTNFINEEKRA